MERQILVSLLLISSSLSLNAQLTLKDKEHGNSNTGMIMNDTLSFNKALKLFEKQIECIISDNRKAQMDLYTENVRYEFPFANDRPRLIEGREAFLKVMTPLWEKARQQSVKVIGCNHEFHATDEVGLYVAVFVLDVEVQERKFSLSFVQLLRIRDNHIAEVREYFNPVLRKEVTDQH